MSYAKPPALRPGDTVVLVAPAGPFDRESFDKGLKVLSARYDVLFDEGVFSRHRYLAGDDARRLRELTDAFHHPRARAIFAARGGYGAMRLLPKLDFARLPHKLLVGFSDITALHLAALTRGRSAIHGPVLTQLGRLPAEEGEHLFGLLETGLISPLAAAATLVPGIAEGPLVGGNLSVLTRLLGTPYLPSLRGAVLLLEDVGERPYRLDRMWTHLRLAGALDGLAGIALGDFTGCEEKDNLPPSAEVLAELAQEVGLPCASGFPIGHGDDRNRAVPLGCRVALDATARTLTLLEPAVERASA